MPSYCHVTLVGNVTRDIELRTVGADNTKVCDLGVAYNKRRKISDGGYEDEAHFFDVTLWGKTAQTAADYLRKGSPVLIEGELAQDRWEKDGQKRSKVKIVGRKMLLLGSKGDNPGTPEQAFQEQAEVPSTEVPSVEIATGDIPF